MLASAQESVDELERQVAQRKRAEGALRENEMLARSLVEHLPQRIFVKDKNSAYLFCNSNFAGDVGLRAEEVVGMDDFAFFPAALAKGYRADDGEVIATGKIKEITERFGTAGEGRWAHTIKVPYRNRLGETAGVLGIYEDVTERKRAEEALQESERRYRKLVDVVPGVLYSYSDRRAGVYYSPQVESVIGYTADYLREHPTLWHDSIHPDDLPAVDREIRESPLERRIEVEYRIRDAHGEWRWLLDRSVQITTEEDGDTLIEGLAIDITERKRAAETVRESERRYRELFDQANEGLLIMTVDGQLSAVNRTFAEMHGYKVDELKGMDIQALDVFGGRALEERADVVRRVQAGEVLRFEVEHYHKDGHVFPLSVTASIVRLGDQPHFMAFHQDITERKRAEEEKATLETQLRQAQKLESVGRLAGGVAHDFNNMLGVIIGHAELALEQVDPAQPLHADLEEIRKAARRSADLTRQLLAFARKQTVKPEVLNLGEIVAGMLKMLQRLIGEDIELKWKPGADLWPVKVDPSQIDQILANLCVNARDAISGVGEMTIETGNGTIDEGYCAAHAGCVPGEYVWLAVSDNGSGMDADTADHIFEPFFTTKGIGEGTGLGLATVYGNVKQNNGCINVYSEPGLGTTFTIYLPRHVGEAAHAQLEGAVTPVRRGHETILLVEDEVSILTLAKTMLEHQGYTVLTASTPGQAIRLATAHSGDIHLLMTDVIMPEMNGRSLAQRLLALRPRLKCLFMSGYTADVIAHRGVLDEGVRFIQKPFSIRDLGTKVRDALDARD